MFFVDYVIDNEGRRCVNVLFFVRCRGIDLKRILIGDADYGTLADREETSWSVFFSGAEHYKCSGK